MATAGQPYLLVAACAGILAPASVRACQEDTGLARVAGTPAACLLRDGCRARRARPGGTCDAGWRNARKTGLAQDLVDRRRVCLARLLCTGDV